MGGIIKLVVLVLIALLVVRLVMRLFSSGNKSTSTLDAIELKPCAYCGTYVDEKKAVVQKGQVFCSKKHAKLAK